MITRSLRRRRLVRCAITLLLSCTASLSFAPVAVAQRVQPLFELFATYGRPALAGSVADAYAASGGVRAGGGVGAAVGRPSTMLMVDSTPFFCSVNYQPSS